MVDFGWIWLGFGWIWLDLFARILGLDLGLILVWLDLDFGLISDLGWILCGFRLDLGSTSLH